AHKAYEDADRAGRRPPFDPTLAALGPALEGRQPVFVEADSRDAIHRALDFAAEFQMKPILFGGRDAWKAAARIAAEGVPVVLRLDFTEGPVAQRRRFLPARPAAAAPPAPEERPELPKRVREDQERQQKEEQHNAAVLRGKGIHFAFSTQGI